MYPHLPASPRQFIEEADESGKTKEERQAVLYIFFSLPYYHPYPLPPHHRYENKLKRLTNVTPRCNSRRYQNWTKKLTSSKIRAKTNYNNPRESPRVQRPWQRKKRKLYYLRILSTDELVANVSSSKTQYNSFKVSQEQESTVHRLASRC